MGVGTVGIMVVEDDADAEPGSARPRCGDALEHVANRPIAHHVLEVLESAGVEQVVVASSADRAGEIRECLSAREASNSAAIQYVEGRGRLDLGGALSLAAPIVGRAPCIAHLASGLLEEPLTRVTARLKLEASDAVVLVHQGSATEGHLSSATRDMLHLAELDPEHAGHGVAGVWMFGAEALGHVRAAGWRDGRDFDLTSVANRITAAGGNFDVMLAGWRQYGGDPLELLELNRIVLDRLETGPYRPRASGNRIEGRVRIHETASVRATVIVGPVVIGPEASISDAYIGPYTSIGPRARIEGAEIERSIVSTGAQITHVGVRIVASVIGRNARVSRDFSLPRALRLRLGEGTEVALS